MIDSIIFDLDGTMWDSTDAVTKAWNETVHEEGYEFVVTKEEIFKIMGLSMQEVADKILFMLPDEKRLPLFKKCCDKEIGILEKEGGKLMEGLLEVLSKLKKKYRLFVVSNCQDGYVQSFLEAHQMWDYFEDFICAGGEGLTKGEANKALIDKYGLSNAVYVGDTEGDKNSALEAGIKFIYARYGFGEVADYEYAIDCLKDLPDVLEELY